jgi:hypothetical protein
VLINCTLTTMSASDSFLLGDAVLETGESLPVETGAMPQHQIDITADGAPHSPQTTATTTSDLPELSLCILFYYN